MTIAICLIACGHLKKTANSPNAAYDGVLVSCEDILPAERRQLSAGTFALGKAMVDDVVYFSGEEAETTLFFFEKTSQIQAIDTVTCYQGSVYFLNSLAQQELETACAPICKAIKTVIIRPDGQIDVQCYYADGNVRSLDGSPTTAKCP